MSVRITVTVAGDHAGREQEIADRLRGAGMNVERVLGSLGMITGSVATERREGLNAVEGVAGVNTEQVYQLPDPGSDVQ